MEGHGRSWKVMDGLFPSLACRIIVSAPVPVPFLWTLNLDLGLGFGTGVLDWAWA